MSLLAYPDLVELVDRGVISGVNPAHIDGSTIDLTLSDEWIQEFAFPSKDVINPEEEGFSELRFRRPSIRLPPQQFILAATNEVFNVPPDITMVFGLRSTLARNGLNQVTSLVVKPGFTGRLTLELINSLSYHTLELHKGMRIGSVTVYRHKIVPTHKLYRGKYNGDMSPHTGKKEVVNAG